MKSFKFLDIILGTFVTVLIVSNIASAAKIVTVGPFTFDAGTLLFPLSYIFGDVLVGALPPEAEWSKNVGQEAFDKIFGLTPRIVLGSLLGYWAGSFANAIVMARMKVATGGRWLAARTIGSTGIGEFFDTIVFCLIAFLGALPNEVVLIIVVSNYVFKVGVEVLFTPVTYVIVNRLKRIEGVDANDAETNLNPFAA